MLKTAFAYVRASTNPKLQKNSIQVQKDVINRFAERSGYKIVEYYVEYRTGADDDRVEFNRVLDRCVSEQAYLLTWKVDRMSRSLSIFKTIQNHLHLFRFAELGDTEPNLLLLSVLLGVAHQERLNIGVRVKATYKTLKAKNPDHPWGNPNMGTVVQPLGEQVRKANALTFNTRIQDLCNDLRKAGYCTLSQLAVKLNEIGVSTRRGSSFTPSSLHRVLQYGV
jgi:DNA invertase Pin-like site-specific DNA recombinase